MPLDYTLLAGLRQPLRAPNVAGAVRAWQDRQAAGQVRTLNLAALARQDAAARAALDDEAVLRRALDWGTDHRTGTVDYGAAAQWAAQEGQRPDLAAKLRDEADARAKAAQPAYHAPHVVGAGGALVDDAGQTLYQGVPKPDAPRAKRTQIVADERGNQWVVNLDDPTDKTPLGMGTYHAPPAPKEPREPEPKTQVIVKPDGTVVLVDKVTRTAYGVTDATAGGVPLKGGKTPTEAITQSGNIGLASHAMDDMEAAMGRMSKADWWKMRVPGGVADLEAQKFRNARTQLSAVITYLMSGKAVTENERRILGTFQPGVLDSPGETRNKLARMRTYLKTIGAKLDAQQGTAPEPMTPAGGHRVPQSWATPKQTTMAEIRATAQQTGKSVGQVTADAKRAGYTVVR